MEDRKYSVNSVKFTGMLVAGLTGFIGIMLISGWKMGDDRGMHTLIQPASIDAGIAFLIGAIGLGLLYHKNSRYAVFPGFLLVFFSCTQLVFYLMDLNLSISSALNLTQHSNNAVFMQSPNFSVIFLLTGLALLASQRMYHPTNLLGNFGGIILSISLITAFGFYFGAPSLYRWGGVVEVNNAMISGSFLIAAGILTFVWNAGKSRRAIIARWMPHLPGYLIAGIGICLWQTMVLQEQQQVYRGMKQVIASVKNELILQLDERVNGLTTLANEWKKNGRPSQETWQNQGAILLSQLGRFQSLCWLDSTLQSRYRLSAQPLNAEIFVDEEHNQKLRASGRPRRPLLLATRNAGLGEREYKLYFPVFNKHKFDGFVSGNFLARDVFDKLTRGFSNDFSIAITDNNEQVYFRYFTLKQDINRQSSVFEHYGHAWRIELWPAPAVIHEARSDLPLVLLIAIFLFAVSTTFMARFAQTARARSRRISAAQQEEAHMLKLLKSSQHKLLERSRQLEQINREMALEIKQRWRAEKKLLEGEYRLQAIVDTAADGIITINGEGVIESFNNAAGEMFGYEASEIIGQSVNVLFPEFARFSEKSDDESFWRAQVESLIASRKELIGQRRDGSMFSMDLAVSAVELETRTLYTAIIRDITDRKRTEDRLQTYADKLERTNRELQEFATVASHDLQEPLRKIQTFSDRISQKHNKALDKSGKDDLNRIQLAAERMQALIQDWLTFSRITTNEKPFTRVNLNTITQEILHDFESEIEKSKGKFTVKGLKSIEADPEQIHQMLKSLIHNAVKFRKSGARPEISITGKMLKNSGVLKEFAANPRQYFELTIQDNGIGFEEKYSAKIFSIFQRLHTRSNYQGTGIGLAICQKVVDRHGGYIRVKSEPGAGSKFIITLPVKQTDDGVNMP